MKTEKEIKDAITTLTNVLKLDDNSEITIEAIRVLNWCLK